VNRSAPIRLQLFILALAPIMVIVLGLTVCLPKHYELKTLALRLKNERQTANAKIRTSRCGLNIAMKVAQARKHRETLQKRIPPSPQDAAHDHLLEFLKTVAQIAEQEHLTNRRVEHGRPEVFDDYKQLSLSVAIDGNLEGIRRFLRRLEQDDRLCRIESLILTGLEREDKPTHAKIHMSIFQLTRRGDPDNLFRNTLTENARWQ